MGRLISLLNTIFGTFLSVTSWAGNQGAKSAGCTRLMSFSEKKARKSSGGPFDNPFGSKSLFDSPFDPPKPKDFLQGGGGGGSSKVSGHSIGNHGWSGGDEEAIVDYTNLNPKDAYTKSLKAGYEKACQAGMDLPNKPQTKIDKGPKPLSRGQAIPGFGPTYGRHDHGKNAENLQNLNLRGVGHKPTTQGYGGASNSASGAGKRVDGGPGGIGQRSVRNYIKF